jgi:rubrerythrin
MAGKQKKLADALEAIVELDLDAISAYDAAIAGVSSAGDKRELGTFKRDHERHVRELGPQIERHGGRIPTGPDLKVVLTKGKTVLAALIGDRAVLTAMKTNEDDTNAAYEHILARGDLDEPLRDLLHQNLSDERRHRAWLEQRIAEEGRAHA